MTETVAPPLQNRLFHRFYKSAIQCGYSDDPAFWVDRYSHDRTFKNPTIPWYDQSVWRTVISELDGHEFEQFLVELFRFLGFSAKRMQLTHDGGVDLLVKTEAGTIAIQAKYRAGLIGPKAIQTVMSGQKVKRADHAAVISLSGFTSTAIQLANRFGVRLFDASGLAQCDSYELAYPPFCLFRDIILVPSYFVASFLSKDWRRSSDGDALVYDDSWPNRRNRIGTRFEATELSRIDPISVMAENWEATTGYNVTARLEWREKEIEQAWICKATKEIADKARRKRSWIRRIRLINALSRSGRRRRLTVPEAHPSYRYPRSWARRIER